MSALPEHSGFTRLRDFGAFQPDISLVTTLKLHRLQSEPALPGWKRLFDRVPFGYGWWEIGKDVISRITAVRRWLLFLVRLGIMVVLCFWIVRVLSWSMLLTALSRVQIEGVLVALVIGVGGVIVSSYQWQGLLRTEHIHYDLADLVKLYLVGISASHFLPTGMGGDALKALYVGRTTGNGAGSASALILCRFTGFFGMLLVVFPILIIWHASLALELIVVFVILSLLVGLVVSGGVLGTALLPELIQKRWGHNRVLTALVHVGGAIRTSTVQPRALGSAIACGALFWGLTILNCSVYAHALGITLPLYFYSVAVPLIALVSCLPISINGFGLRESAFIYVFATVHIAPTTSLLLALLLDVQALCFAIAGGWFYLFIMRKRCKGLFL